MNKRRVLYIFVIWAFFSAPLGIDAADSLAVSNREPDAKEFGYRPVDGSTVCVTPPGFVWLPEPEAVSYILQCSQNSNFSDVGYEKAQIPRSVHCPPGGLKPGLWYWRYTFVNRDGDRAAWSQVRNFTIAGDAELFPQPTLPQLLERIPKDHPKLFVRPESVFRFGEDLKENHPQMWNQFIENVKGMMDEPVVSEEPAPYPDGKRGTSKENIDLWRKNRKIVTNAVDNAANLAFAYRLTGEKRYGERARDWMLAVTAWPADGTTSYAYNDECGMPVLNIIPRAYTWAYDILSDGDKKQIVDAMTARGNEVYQYLQKRRHTVSPFESHRNRAWHFLNEASIAFIEDIPEASDWLQYTMDVFFNVYPVWGDDDGGWHEGVAYWRGYMDRITWWLDTLKASLRIDGYKKPFFKNAGDFPFYVMPPNTEFGGFGDSSDKITSDAVAPIVSVMADRTKNPYWKWYASTTVQPPTNEKPTYLDLLRVSSPNVGFKIPENAPESKIFHGTGIASLHTNLLQSTNDVHVLFKSSPFGTQSHGFNAQNSFLLWAYGKPLLTWSGHRDWHGSEHHKNWMWETFSDNSITVNGEGQLKHSPLARGKIVGEILDPNFDYVAGDATEAYEGKLTKFIRHICFVKPRLLVVVDELEAPEPSTFQYHLNGVNEFNVESQYKIDLENEPAAARIAFVTPSDLKITQSDKQDPASVGFEGRQWRLQAETANKSKQMCFINVIRPYPANKVFQSKYNYASKGNVQMYYGAIDNHKIMIFINPHRETFAHGGITTDAGFTLMATYKDDTDDSILLASDVGKIVTSGVTIYESKERKPYYIQWKDIKNKLPKREEAKETEKTEEDKQ